MVSSLLAGERCSEAGSAALRNYSANLKALAEVQPEVLGQIRRPAEEWAWVYARDRALTGISAEGRWLADCSVPYQAAVTMVKSLDLRGSVACLLAPVHGAQIRRTLELLGPEQGVLVLMPEAEKLGLALHCEDFSDVIGRHRLLFAVGVEWVERLREVFRANPGLPTPNLFVRPPTTDDAVGQRLIEGAQNVFREAIAAQGRRLAEMGGRTPDRSAGVKRVCVVAPSVFRLWSDAGAVLAETLNGAVEVVRFDPDRPTTASNVALAEAVDGVDALVTANFGRSDVPAQVVPQGLPWVTWATTPAVPVGQRAAAGDRLIVADPAWVELAVQSGWDRSHVTVAGWPAVRLAEAQAGAPTALAVDTRPIRTDVDEDTFEFSSHMVLWELIVSELRANPLLAAEDPEAYLSERMARLSIVPEKFNRAMFLEQLIFPAYHQGIARLLLRAQVPLRLYGRGWAENEEFAGSAGGELHCREDLARAVTNASSMVRPTPVRFAHAVDAFPRAVMTPGGAPDGFVRRAKSVQREKPRVPGDGLDAELLLSVLRRTWQRSFP